MAFQLTTVLITDKVDEKCGAILRANGIKVEFNTALAKDKAALLAEIAVSWLIAFNSFNR